jgi:hypothetical protein
MVLSINNTFPSSKAVKVSALIFTNARLGAFESTGTDSFLALNLDR